MFLLNSLRKMVSRSTASRPDSRSLPGRRPLTRRLEVEVLEGRVLPAYAFITIDPPGSTATNDGDSGNNDSGQIVGRYVDAGGTHGYLLSGGTYTTLDAPSSPRTVANGINASGQIVGAFDVAGVRHGYLLSGGSYTTVDVPTSSATVARGINDLGQIVGFTTVAGVTHGFLLSGGTYTTIDGPGATLTHAARINNAGQIVGRYVDAGGTQHGYLLSGGVFTTLDVPGASLTTAVGINDVGQIAGGYRDAGGTTHGYLLSGGVYTTLDVPGASFTLAHGINDAGQIVGEYVDGVGIRHGFLATLPARVDSVVVNDGSAQRSMVSSLTVTFDSAVTLDSGAFEVRTQGGSLVGVSVTTSQVGGRTIAVLTFTGSDVIAGSLADGNYVLTILGDRVHDATGRSLDGDGDGEAGSDHSDAFFRLFGDSDGDRDVDLHDLGRFLSTFGRKQGDPHYLDYLDVNGDDRVGLIDLFAFVHRLGTHLNT